MEEDGVEPIFIGVSTVLLAEMWEVWQRGATGEGVLSSFSGFVSFSGSLVARPAHAMPTERPEPHMLRSVVDFPT